MFGAVSNGSTLAARPASARSPATRSPAREPGSPTGKVVAGYLAARRDRGGQDAWDVVFDPVKHDLRAPGPRPATGGLQFVATQDGGFAVSWHAPDGTVEARGYDEFAYGGDVPGWYGPVRQITGDLAGVTADGHVIAQTARGQELYDLMNACARRPAPPPRQRRPGARPAATAAATLMGGAGDDTITGGSASELPARRRRRRRHPSAARLRRHQRQPGQRHHPRRRRRRLGGGRPGQRHAVRRQRRPT